MALLSFNLNHITLASVTLPAATVLRQTPELFAA